MHFPANAPLKDAPAAKKMVWFGGSTALLEGQGVCYNNDYGTASAFDGSRFNRVELPSQSNNLYFAGVAAQDYAAVSGGQMIEIYIPGSVCNILAKASCTLGSGRLTCEATGDYAGYFRYEGFSGEGSAKPMQTVDRSSTAGKVQAVLEAGEPSGLVECPVLSTSGGADTFMVGGLTIFETATTLSAHITFTLADGVLNGLRKGFKCMQTMTTNDVVVTVTSGVMGVGAADPTGTLSSITMDANDEECFLVWSGTETNGHWAVTYVLGTVLA